MLYNDIYWANFIIKCIFMSFMLSSASEILQSLAHRLRDQRLVQGLPQRELAEKAGLSLGAVRNLERNGASSLETLVRVVQTLGLVTELDELFRLKTLSIAQMEKNAQATQRQRAPRRKGS